MNKKKLSVGIIDLNINNMFSIYRGCLKADYKAEIIDPRKKKLNYDMIILPGVGAYKSGMEFLKKHHFDDKLRNYLDQPNSFVYGICLGMQLLFYKSYEFVDTKGLGFISGQVVKFRDVNAKVTHLGWNKIKINDKNFKKFENKYFYFVHSYYTKPKYSKDVFATTNHGTIDFCSAVRKRNIFGTQFHPEKSGDLGIKFLKNLKKLID